MTNLATLMEFDELKAVPICRARVEETFVKILTLHVMLKFLSQSTRTWYYMFEICEQVFLSEMGVQVGERGGSS